MLKLTDRYGYQAEVWVQSEMIERIYERMGSTSEIVLTSGKHVSVMESPEAIAQMMEPKP
jgi:uncharacterized protein YlzI (FlbEa/FlbD family)